jgi:hypothetical protein
VEVGINLRCAAVPHSSGCILICGQPVAPTLRDAPDKIAHGFLGNDASFATGEGDFRVMDGRKDFRARALALFPERKCLLQRVFLTAKPAALNRLTHEGAPFISTLRHHYQRPRHPRASIGDC